MVQAATISPEAWLFAGAALVSAVAFGALILAPTVGSFGRPWEKATAIVISLIILAALVMVGLAIGVLIVLHWDQISGWFG